VMGAVILQSLFSIPLASSLEQGSLVAELMDGSLSPAVTEEVLKGLAVAMIAISFRREFDGWIDGIIYGAMAGFGFAYVENILYLWGTETWEEWWTVLLLRTVVFGGLHGLWTALTGIGFGLARYQRRTWQRVLCVSGGLLLAIAGHMIHNGALTLAARAGEENTGVGYILIALLNYGSLVLLMGLLWWLSLWVSQRTLAFYLKDEVPHHLSPRLYAAICQPRTLVGIPKQQKRTLLHVASELAQKKLQRQKMGEESNNSQIIAEYQRQLASLSQAIEGMRSA
ncbi:MAG: PrsW family intramembrane metalloprotease, partial [Thermostichales cyanobacterium SZTDM-1c_bins_54]